MSVKAAAKAARFDAKGAANTVIVLKKNGIL
jgi:hypothetical protein